MLLNIRSIKKKLQELEIFIESLVKKPDIIIITESWLKEDELKFFNLKNYQTIGNCRPNQRGGGIIIFINEDIKFNIVKNEHFEKNHLIVINSNDLNTKIAAFYRSPSSNSDKFIELLENSLDKLDNIICLGDANFDLLKGNDVQVQNYVETLKTNNFNILNDFDMNSFTYREIKNGKTHVSILDHIFTDKFDKSGDFKVEIQEVCFSDHRALLFECDLNSEITNSPKKVTFYDFDKINNDLINFDFDSIDFGEFMDFFSNSVKNHSQIKYYKNSPIEKKPWIDGELKIELKKRKELYNLKKNNPQSLVFKSEFNKQKNKVGVKIIQKRKEFFDSRVGWG